MPVPGDYIFGGARVRWSGAAETFLYFSQAQLDSFRAAVEHAGFVNVSVTSAGTLSAGLVVDATCSGAFNHLDDVRSLIAGALYGAGAGNGQGSLIVLQQGNTSSGGGSQGNPTTYVPPVAASSVPSTETIALIAGGLFIAWILFKD